MEITIEQLAGYLTARGWKRARHPNSRILVFVEPGKNPVVVTLPVDMGLSDAKLRMEQALASLALLQEVEVGELINRVLLGTDLPQELAAPSKRRDSSIRFAGRTHYVTAYQAAEWKQLEAMGNPERIVGQLALLEKWLLLDKKTRRKGKKMKRISLMLLIIMAWLMAAGLAVPANKARSVRSVRLRVSGYNKNVIMTLKQGETGCFACGSPEQVDIEVVEVEGEKK